MPLEFIEVGGEVIPAIRVEGVVGTYIDVWHDDMGWHVRDPEKNELVSPNLDVSLRGAGVRIEPQSDKIHLSVKPIVSRVSGGIRHITCSKRDDTTVCHVRYLQKF